MASIRDELVYAALKRASALTDYNVFDNLAKRYEFRKRTILSDKSLTKYEKLESVRILTEDYDYYKISYNEGTKRICENCKLECLATFYCEYCVRKYLKANSNWTSGNDNIDNLIKKCQMETLMPDMIIEWIPYRYDDFDNLQNIKYLTSGGFSDI